MSKYGVLLIAGNRTHQEDHARHFAADPRCHLVAVTDEIDITQRRTELNRQLAQKYNIPYLNNLEDALTRDDVSIISVCAEVERRGRVIPKCAMAGKHLYLDKPLASSLSDLDSIVNAIEQAGVCNQMQSNRIFSPWAQAAKRAIEAGQIGTLLAVHADELFAKGKGHPVPDGFIRQEREDIKRYTFVEAKAELFDIGVYMVGLIHWLTEKKTKRVFAMTGNYFFTEHIKCDIEDFGALALTLEGDISATVAAGRVGWMSHAMAGHQQLTLVGTNGVLTFGPWDHRLEIYNDDSNFSMPEVHLGDPMGMWRSTVDELKVDPKQRWVSLDPATDNEADIRAFVDCIETGQEPIMNARKAAAISEVIIAGYASATRGEEVNVPLPRGETPKSFIN